MKALSHMLLFFVFAAALASGVRPVSGQAGPGEYEVKAAFVYNFLAFIEWPSSANRTADAVRMCILGDPTRAGAFDDLEGQVSAGRRIEVSRPASLDDLKGCDVLFIASSEQRSLARIMKALQGTPVLSIGDTAGFAQQGVVINFYLEQKKVRFEINMTAAQQAGLTISSKLLKLAGSVYGASPGGE